MTTLKIDIRGMAASTHPDDRVILYAPEVRTRIGGGLVSTYPEEVELVDGQATVENVEPGPLVVRFECLGIADTTEKRGIVPDSGVVTLDDVLELKFTWTPPIITAGLQQIIDEMNRAVSTLGGVVGEAIQPLRDIAQHADTRASAAESAATQALTGVVIAQNSATSAALSAMSANSRVGLAVSKADNATSRVEALEALGGLSPQSPVDGQTASLMTQRGTLTRSVLDSSYAERSRAVEALPLTDVTITPRGGSPIPTDFFDGVLWGVDNNNIHASTDGGVTWSFVSKVLGVTNIQRVMKASDGEVLAVSTTSVRRSTGWGTSTTTWAEVLANPTASFFYPWAISGDGQKFIIVHYAGSSTQSPERSASRYGWISLDGGLTWAVKWDTQSKWGSDVNSRTHIHTAAYDPWEDRFFISEGHVEVTGVYVSYDDGETWSRIPYGTNFDFPPGNSPTVAIPTDYGIVFGSDDGATNGAMVLPRGSKEIVRAYSRRGVTNTVLLGYAHMGARDPRTGVVYTVWELNEAYASDLGAQIIASDGRVAGPVWEDTEPTRRLWRRIAIDDQGNLLAWEQTTNSILRAKIPGTGVVPAHLGDTGRVLGGKTVGYRGTVALGVEAVADGGYSVAVGNGVATGDHAIAIGLATTNLAGVAIGQNATSDDQGVSLGANTKTVGGIAVGQAAISAHARSTAVGRAARAAREEGLANTSATAIGWSALASGADGHATSVGAGSQATASYSTAAGSNAVAASVSATALGRESSATTSNRATVVGAQAQAAAALGGTAVGAGAKVSQTNTLALGADAESSGDSSSAVGAKAKAVNARSTAIGADAVTSLSNRSTVIGSQAAAESALDGTALGAGAKTRHTSAVALGADVQTTATHQVHMGPRHVQINPPSTEPSAPTAGAAIYTRVLGGKTQLVARFPTGDPVIIAQEI